MNVVDVHVLGNKSDNLFDKRDLWVAGAVERRVSPRASSNSVSKGLNYKLSFLQIFVSDLPPNSVRVPLFSVKPF